MAVPVMAWIGFNVIPAANQTRLTKPRTNIVCIGYRLPIQPRACSSSAARAQRPSPQNR